MAENDLRFSRGQKQKRLYLGMGIEDYISDITFFILSRTIKRKKINNSQAVDLDVNLSPIGQGIYIFTYTLKFPIADLYYMEIKDGVTFHSTNHGLVTEFKKPRYDLCILLIQMSIEETNKEVVDRKLNFPEIIVPDEKLQILVERAHFIKGN